MKFSNRSGISVLVAAFLIAPVAAQETRATLSGTITDQSGAAVPNATLHLINVETSVEATTESNQLGQYHFLFVNPGTYKLAAEMSQSVPATQHDNRRFGSVAEQFLLSERCHLV